MEFKHKTAQYVIEGREGQVVNIDQEKSKQRWTKPS